MNLNNTMIEFYSIMEKVLKNLKMENELRLMKEHIYKKRKPLEEFTLLIEKNEFEIKSVTNDQFTYKFVDGTTMFNHYFIQLAFMNGWKNILPVDKHIKIFKLIEEEMNHIAEKDGFFKLSIPFVLIDCAKK